IPLVPDFFSVNQFLAQFLRLEQFRMDAHDENLLVIGAVENADASAFRQTARRAPEKIVRQFLVAGAFEAEDLATLRIDARHDVFDGAVLARGVHRLKNQQQRVAAVGIKQTLPRTHLPGVRFEQFLVMLLRLVERLHFRRPFFQPDLFAFANTDFFRFNFHRLFLSCDDELEQRRFFRARWILRAKSSWRMLVDHLRTHFRGKCAKGGSPFRACCFSCGYSWLCSSGDRFFLFYQVVALVYGGMLFPIPTPLHALPATLHASIQFQANFHQQAFDKPRIPDGWGWDTRAILRQASSWQIGASLLKVGSGGWRWR